MHGVLALVVGPSGAGKDSIIEGARSAFGADPRFSFPLRVVTRQACDAEAHGVMTPEEFEDAQMNGYFALSWSAHGLNYGIVAADVAAIESGVTVVINVSRGAVAAAESIARHVTVFNVTAPVEILAARIAQRGREDIEEITARLERSSPITAMRAKIVSISNDRDLKSAVGLFCSELTRAHLSATTPNG